ncbi:MAG: O-antigen ligase family protein [Candidatus Scalindua sp.]|nr:O-antigen ligase family protein [Candidatus Scalindua sp.]
MWLAIILFTAVITGIALCDEKWIYFGLILSPFIIYVCIEKPYIFPFGLYAFLLPFGEVLSVEGFESGATLTKFIGALTIPVLCFKGAFEKRLNKPDIASIWWVLFITYGICTVWWAVEPEATLSRISTAMGLIIVYLVVASYKFQKSEYETIKLFMVAGGFLSALFAIYNFGTIQNFSRVNLLHSETGRTGASDYAFSIAIPISICVGMVMKQNSKMIKGLFGFALVAMIFTVLISGSRGGMVGVSTIFIVYILSSKKKITTGIVLIIIGIILIPFIPDFVYERWGAATETGGAGRLDIWYVGLRVLKKYWLFGTGLDNFYYAYEEFAHYAPTFKGMNRSAHNIFLKYFAELGIIGFTLFLLAIMKHYKVIKTRSSQYDIEAIMLKAAFWGMIVSSLFIDSSWRKSFWLLWMIIMIRRNTLSEEEIYETKSNSILR